MLIGASLLILSIIVLFSLVLGGGFTSGVAEIAIDNLAIVNGTSSTFVIPPESIFYGISATGLEGAIYILIATLIGIAGAVGISVVSTGLNPQSSRIIVLALVYGVLWWLLSIPAFGLISSIAIFGPIIYVFISVAYVIGCIQKITSGGS